MNKGLGVWSECNLASLFKALSSQIKIAVKTSNFLRKRARRRRIKGMRKPVCFFRCLQLR